MASIAGSKNLDQVQALAIYIAGHADKAEWQLKMYLDLVQWVRLENPTKNTCTNVLSCLHAMVALITDMSEGAQLDLLRDIKKVWRKVKSTYVVQAEIGFMHL